MKINSRRLVRQAAAVTAGLTATAGLTVALGVGATAHADASFPVKLQLTGWTCQQPQDQKTVCTDGTSSVSVNWRSADSHDKYTGHGRRLTILGQPGRLISDGGPIAVGSVQQGGFVTVQTYEQATRKAVASVAEALVWA